MCFEFVQVHEHPVLLLLPAGIRTRRRAGAACRRSRVTRRNRRRGGDRGARLRHVATYGVRRQVCRTRALRFTPSRSVPVDFRERVNSTVKKVRLAAAENRFSKGRWEQYQSDDGPTALWANRMDQGLCLPQMGPSDSKTQLFHFKTQPA